MALPKLTFNLTGAGSTLLTGAGGLYGINVAETAAVAAVATIQVHDGTSAAGPVIATIRLGADGENQTYWDRGVRFATGLHVVVTGQAIGTLLYGGGGALTALPFAGADLLLRTGGATLDSIVAAETAGAAAEWQMFDALSAAGTPFASASPAANETFKYAWADGVRVTTGLHYEQVSGAVSGNAYIY